MNAKTTSLFVYGSLMRGLVHHNEMRGATFIGEKKLLAHHLVLYEDAYPALVQGTSAEHTVVSGELYVVSSLHLARLDIFEECPRLYQRRSVELSDGAAAQSYGISAERARVYPVISGDFRQYLHHLGP